MGIIKKAPHTIKSFPKIRQVIIDLLVIGAKKHAISAIGQIDVTVPLERIHQLKKSTGKDLSFTSYILFCYASAINDHKHMQAHRKGRKKLIIFDDVDVACIVERDFGTKKIPTSYIVRGANNKTFLEISDEIRDAQTVKSENIATEMEKANASTVAKLPRFVRRLIFYIMSKNPYVKKDLHGTVGLTAIGMFAQGGGTAIPITPHQMTLVLGGVERQPWVVGDEIKIRNIMWATMTMDHDVVDGGPATRFIADLRKRITSGYGFDEME
ncbi:MAG: 2-oxo acid dehydrogenase subunit E2 [Promethearchaeota archaeon]